MEPDKAVKREALLSPAKSRSSPGFFPSLLVFLALTLAGLFLAPRPVQALPCTAETRVWGSGAPAASEGPCRSASIQHHAWILRLEVRQTASGIRVFLWPDPIGFAGGEDLYAYSEDAPIPNNDPTGLVSPKFRIFLGIAFAAWLLEALGIQYAISKLPRVSNPPKPIPDTAADYYRRYQVHRTSFPGGSSNTGIDFLARPVFAFRLGTGLIRNVFNAIRHAHGFRDLVDSIKENVYPDMTGAEVGEYNSGTCGASANFIIDQIGKAIGLRPEESFRAEYLDAHFRTGPFSRHRAVVLFERGMKQGVVFDLFNGAGFIGSSDQIKSYIKGNQLEENSVSPTQLNAIYRGEY